MHTIAIGCPPDIGPTTVADSKERGFNRVMVKPSARDVRVTRLVNQYIGFVGRVLRNYGVPVADIDDAVQRTFLVVTNRLDDIVPAAERSFLFRAARHVAGHARRSQARRRQEPLGDRDFSHDVSPEHLLTQKRGREVLDKILDGLPNDLRSVFILFEFEDLSGPEIADLMGIPRGTVASRIRRARLRFRTELARFEAASDLLGQAPRARCSGE